MQLKIQRSQRMGGAMGGTVLFCLDVQADYSHPEADNIAKYKLGKQVVYNSRAAKRHIERAKDSADGGTVTGYIGGAVSLVRASLSLNISIDSLGRGQHIECKDLEELLEAEDAVMVACRMLKRFLETAATFNGSIALIDFDDGEKLHTGTGSLELITGPSISLADSLPVALPESNKRPTLLDQFNELEPEQHQRILLIAAGIIVLLIVLVKCV